MHSMPLELDSLPCLAVVKQTPDINLPDSNPACCGGPQTDPLLLYAYSLQLLGRSKLKPYMIGPLLKAKLRSIVASSWCSGR